VRRVLVSASLIAMLAPSLVRAEPIRAAVATIGLKPDGPHADRLRARIRTALATVPEMTLLDEAAEKRLFASIEPQRPPDQVKEAQKSVRKAQKALRNFELDQAQAGYAKATELLQPLLGLEEAVDVDKERLALGAALAYALRNDEQIGERILEYAIRYGAEGPPTWPPELIERLKTATPPSNTKLSVKTTPAGAEIFVDGSKAGASPADLEVRPGNHRIEVRKSGYFFTESFATTSGLGPTEVTLALLPDVSSYLRRQPAAKPLEPELAARIFTLASEAGANVVIVAGLNKGRINLRRVDSTGESAQRYEADDSDEGVAFAVSQMFEPARSPDGDGPSPWIWVGAGAGAAAVAGGVTLRLLAVDAQQDLISRQGALTQREAFDRDSDVDARATSGAVLMGVGTAAITGMAVWLIYDLIASDSR
jgi:hypothetical protein